MLLTPQISNRFLSGLSPESRPDPVRRQRRPRYAVVLDLNAEAKAALDAMTEDQAHAFNNNPADPSVPGRDTPILTPRAASSSALWLRASSPPPSPL
jgi:hypothetical protein